MNNEQLKQADASQPSLTATGRSAALIDTDKCQARGGMAEA